MDHTLRAFTACPPQKAVPAPWFFSQSVERDGLATGTTTPAPASSRGLNAFLHNYPRLGGNVATLPLSYELTAYAGTTFRKEFKWLPGGTSPQDFTGWAATMRIGPSAGAALVEMSTANGAITLTSAGQIIVGMLPSDTAMLRPGIYAYVLDLTDMSGTVTRFLRGRFEVVRDVGPKL